MMDKGLKHFVLERIYMLKSTWCLSRNILIQLYEVCDKNGPKWQLDELLTAPTSYLHDNSSPLI